MINRAAQNCSLIAQADEAMARGDVRQAASLLEVAAQRGSDASTLLRLATIKRSVGDLAGAMKAATAAVELAPRNFVMSLLLGSLREATGAIHGAERAYRSACAAAPFDLTFQPGVSKQLHWAQRRVAAVEQWRERLLNWQPQELLPDLTGDEEHRLRHFRANILENLDAGPLAPPVFAVPGIRSRRYFDPRDFSGMEELERSTDLIRAEFELVAQSNSTILSRLAGSHASEADSNANGAWSMIPLIRNGAVVEEFASLCPRTMELAKGLDQPKIGLISPSLYFSMLEPNGRIAPHTGITNARLIAHLPLIVPGRCGFTVGGETRAWEEGKALVFDDMTVHEAWNAGDSTRVVLIADLWRPEFSQREREGIEDLMACELAAAQA